MLLQMNATTYTLETINYLLLSKSVVMLISLIPAPKRADRSRHENTSGNTRRLRGGL